LKLLIISHLATRTGAPIVLLQIAKILAKHPHIQFDMLFFSDGPLVPEFKKLANHCYVNKKRENVLDLIFRKLKKCRREQLFIRKIIRQIGSVKYDWIYANTIITLETGIELKRKLRVPLIAHIHELEYAIETKVDPERFKSLVTGVDLFIAVSDAVRKHLVDYCRIDEKKIDVLYSCSGDVLSDPESVNRIRNELGIKQDTFVVGGSGQLSWTKGPDVFLLVAREFLKRYGRDNILFLWVGGGLDTFYYRQLRIDLDKSGISDYVKFVGAQDNRFDWFTVFSAFLFSSKEESFGLVALENAFLAKPIVCFEKCGGFNEFLTPECGITVPFLDICAAVEALQTFRSNPDSGKVYGENAKARAVKEYGSDSFEIRFQEIINSRLK